MRVLIVPSWYPQDDKPNSGIFFKEQAVALQEFGVEVVVAYPEIHSLKELIHHKITRGFNIKCEDGIETYRIKEFNYFPKVRNGSGFIYYRRLNNIYKKLSRKGKRPDIIHAHSALWGGWAAARISKKYKIPLIITEHSTSFLIGLIKDYQVPYIKEAYEQAKKVIVVGPGLKNELKKYTIEEKINLIPNIVDTSRFKPSGTTKRNNKFRFFSLAFLTYKKGFDILLKAFSEAFKSNIDVELVIAGDGEEKDNLQKLVQELGIDKQVTFLGELTRDQVVTEMQNCDAFVLASRYETFGVVYIEALACGKPIIATKCGGPEMIVNKKNGILVSPNNINELSSALQHIEKNIKKYNSNEIIMDCIERFSKQSIVNKILIQYKKLLCKGKIS